MKLAFLSAGQGAQHVGMGRDLYETYPTIRQVLDRAPDADHMLDDMIHWPDNPESAWYYEDVQEATNCHTYRWSGSLERWIQITDMRTYAALVRDALRSAR